MSFQTEYCNHILLVQAVASYITTYNTELVCMYSYLLRYSTLIKDNSELVLPFPWGFSIIALKNLNIWEGY